MSRPREGIIVAIGVFKLVKATVLTAVGVEAWVQGPVKAAHSAERAVTWIGAAPGRQTVHRVIQELAHVPPATARLVGLVSFAYAAIFLVEGTGLVLGKRWAEWLTVVITGSFIPLELYELVAHFGLGKVLTLAVNVVIVAYLVWRRLDERKRRERERQPQRPAAATLMGAVAEP